MAKNEKHKSVVIVWLAIYPLITLILYFFGDQLTLLPLPLRTFVLTVVAVPLMLYVIVPFYNKIFSSWLR